MANKVTEQHLSPVFIVSPTGKSGTNFLAQILIAIGLCERPRVEVLTREDFLLFHSERVVQYVSDTANIWKRWERDDDCVRRRAKQLLKSIGDGILLFVGMPSDARKRLLLKTPSSQHVATFPDLFPTAKLILLVRDGRDATESQVKAGYRSDYESAFQNWAERVRELLAFIRGRGHDLEGTTWILVRYETLVTDPQTAGKEIADFLGLNENTVDVAPIAMLPVLGSAYIGDELDPSGSNEWRIVQRPEGFNPLGRWRTWDRRRQDLFKSIAGRELIELGYEADDCW